MSEVYIGLISGTSADGIDTAAIEIDNNNVVFCGGLIFPYPKEVRQEVLSLSQPMASKGEQRIDRLGHLDRQVGSLFAEAALTLSEKIGTPLSSITAIGSHGQTVRHRPQGKDHFTMQIGDPNVIAFQTQRPVVADFRRMDIAAGGQGAPLVPLFHNLLFSNAQTNRVILNLGGIANITVLAMNMHEVKGFDTGPANALLDYWFQRHHSGEFDSKGSWSASGKVHQELLKHMLADPYFSMPPPKSTGREYFDAKWLEQKLKGCDPADPQDVQATLTELTAITVATQIKRLPTPCEQVITCGGGVHNTHLMERLAQHLKGIEMSQLDNNPIPGDFIEAATFAWLAERRVHNMALDYRSITGSSRPLLMGSVFDSGVE